MENTFSITLKNESYSIPREYKRDIQNRVTGIDEKINTLKSQIVDLKNDQKKYYIELLNDRQLILHNNPLPKQLTMQEMQQCTKYVTLKKLLTEYDRIHGTYYKPEIGH
jgi:regulator of replication initiation timing